jgi:TldD protein
MTNVSIEPGDAGSLEDLIADTDDGLYLETNRSWSIDDRRLQFQFATEVARDIRGGRLGRLYRNASYAGITPRFWGSLDAVCGPSEWRLWGLTNCGKGEPGQIMAVSHGAASRPAAQARPGTADH